MIEFGVEPKRKSIYRTLRTENTIIDIIKKIELKVYHKFPKNKLYQYRDSNTSQLSIKEKNTTLIFD
tara:strand:- start:1013 stop:1213 length:201 start_codon:yes stop_codon:yes gene_type:complete